MFGPEYLPIYIGTIIVLLIVMVANAVVEKHDQKSAKKSTFACTGDRADSQDYMAVGDAGLLKTINGF